MAIQRQHPDLRLQYRQSNHEGDLIDWLQQTDVDAVILNAGGYSHTSVAIRDAVEYVREQGIPVVEVHISDITRREPFRRLSLLTDVCSHTIMGQGIMGYEQAILWLLNK